MLKLPDGPPVAPIVDCGFIPNLDDATLLRLIPQAVDAWRELPENFSDLRRNPPHHPGLRNGIIEGWKVAEAHLVYAARRFGLESGAIISSGRLCLELCKLNPHLGDELFVPPTTEGWTTRWPGCLYDELPKFPEYLQRAIAKAEEVIAELESRASCLLPGEHTREARVSGELLRSMPVAPAVAAEPAIVPATAGKRAPQLPGVVSTEGCRFVQYGENDWSFTRCQAEIIHELHSVRQRGTREIRVGALESRLKKPAGSLRVKKTFTDKGGEVHPAFGTMIRTPKRGWVGFYLPSE